VLWRWLAAPTRRKGDGPAAAAPPAPTGAFAALAKLVR
jgi:hypothetical protein